MFVVDTFTLNKPILIVSKLDWAPEIIEHDNAMAPAIYLNKQIDKLAPHKKQRRGKFKRSGRK